VGQLTPAMTEASNSGVITLRSLEITRNYRTARSLFPDILYNRPIRVAAAHLGAAGGENAGLGRPGRAGPVGGEAA